MVILKSNGEGFTITLSQGPWKDVLAELAMELERPRAVDIFRGARVRIEAGERALTPLEVEQLVWLLDLHDMKFEWGETPTQAPLPGLEAIASPFERQAESQALWEEAALHARTLRSGQSLRYPGHVVIVGDVNPGAEVIAAGDVLVWGRVRGVVHAGASGDNTAVVGALSLAPMQLRIGKHIARAPDERDRRAHGPEIARVRDGRIVIESWNPRD
jgi:septum site-determining protein MinC